MTTAFTPRIRVYLGLTVLLMTGNGFAQTGVRAQLTPTQQSTLASPMTGLVKQIAVKTGSRVAKGDLLLRFDCRSLLAESDMANAQLRAAKTQFDVNRELADYDNISTLELSLSEIAVQEAKAKHQLTRLRISDCDLRAPFSGEITHIETHAHEFATIGDPLLELVNTDALQVEWVMPASALPNVALDSLIRFQADVQGAAPVSARITRIVDSVDPVSQTVKVIAIPSKTLPAYSMPGISGEVAWNTAIAAD